MEFKSGLVALIGQPNVGKSTLLNALVGQKVSIVSSKPQTTRRRALGFCQSEKYQIVFVDTPGIHEPHTRLGRAMVEQARGAMADVDAMLVVVDGARKPDDMERQIAELVRPLAQKGIPVILCMNKMDILKAEFVIENVELFTALYGTERYMLTSASKGQNLDKLVELILEVLPEGEAMFPDDEYTDQTTRFMVSELIREKVLLKTRQEVPHATAVHIEGWEEEEDGILTIEAQIVVEKASQRSILIGKGGQFIKQVGIESRAEIEELLDRRVRLELFVKVREGWRQNMRILRELEYTE